MALFAQHGLDATGLDIAPTGVKAARRYLEQATAAASSGSGSSSSSTLDDRKMCVELADFFEYDPGYEFDVILDYTCVSYLLFRALR